MDKIKVAVRLRPFNKREVILNNFMVDIMYPELTKFGFSSKLDALQRSPFKETKFN